jgi:hypothetical protein
MSCILLVQLFFDLSLLLSFLNKTSVWRVILFERVIYSEFIDFCVYFYCLKSRDHDERD